MLQQGVSDLNDPLTMVADDAIWLHGDIYINKKQSLQYLNYEQTKLIANLVSMEYDPFNPAFKLNT